VQRFVGFVYQEVRMHCRPGEAAVDRDHPAARMRDPRDAVRVVYKPAPGYDAHAQRRWLFVPLWGIPTHFLLRSTPRGWCRAWGIVEHIPWEQRQAPCDLRHDGILSTLGASAELAGNGARLPDSWKRYIGRWNGLCSGAWRTANCAGRIYRRGRNSLGTRLEGGTTF